MQRHLVVLAGRRHWGLRVGESARHGLDQGVEVEGLGEVVVCAAAGRLDRRHQRAVGAHHDDRQVWPARLHARQQIEPVAVGHDDIGDDEVALAVGDPVPQGRGLVGRAHGVALACQRAGQDGANRAIVVGDQDGRPAHHRPRLRRAAARSRNSVAPGRLSTVTTPPWSSTILATRARPRPELVSLLLTKGSKTWSTRSCGMPGPSSVTGQQGQRDAARPPERGARRRPLSKAVTIRIVPPSRRLGARSSPGSGRPGPARRGCHDRRQRRVVALDDGAVAGEAGPRQPHDVVEHLVDVDQRARHRVSVREHLHAVQQTADAIDLLGDQHGRIARSSSPTARLQQLGGAANAGKRVLHLVRQGCRQPGDRTRRAPGLEWRLSCSHR